MLAIERVGRFAGELRELPVLSRIGLALMVIGAGADVLVHLSGAGHGLHGHGSAEQAAHLIGIVGMVCVMAGVMAHGARRHLRDRRNGGTRNAHR